MPNNDIEIHTEDILALVNDHPLYAVVQRRLRKLFESMELLAQSGNCVAIISKLHGKED